MTFRRILLLFLLLFFAYMLFWPVPIEPGTWAPPPAPQLEGDYAENQLLAVARNLFEGQCVHCEDVAIDSLGHIYGGAENGDIVLLNEKTGKKQVLVNTSGRPLGLHFDQTGNLLIADAHKGLLSMNTEGELTTLSTTYGDLPYAFTDDLEVAADGMIYFSDASHKFSIENFKLDLIEHQPNGRFLSYDPVTHQTQLLLDSLYFANGIAVSHEQNFVLVNETGKYRVLRYWLQGPRKGKSEIFIDNLPGYPDGISQGSNGIFWLTLISPRKPALDKLMTLPFFRKMIVRLPDPLQPAPERYGFVLGLNRNGKVVYNLQDPAGGYAQISSVQEFEGHLYFGSLAETGVGKIRIPR